MDDSEVDNFFNKLNNTIKKIEEATTTIEEATTEILNDKEAKEIHDDVVMLYKDHIAVFHYLFLKYQDTAIQKVNIFNEINQKMLDYCKLYVTLDILLTALESTINKVENELITEQRGSIKSSIETNKYVLSCKYFVNELFKSSNNIKTTNNNLYIISSSKYEKEIMNYQEISTDNLNTTKDNLKIYGFNVNGGRKKPTKPKPKGKHDDMTMKDIKELCKANQIKLSRVVEGKRVAYKKKELITKLKRKKLV